MKRSKEKILNVEINAPNDLNKVYERYAEAIYKIYSEIENNKLQEALKVANNKK